MLQVVSSELPALICGLEDGLVENSDMQVVFKLEGRDLVRLFKCHLDGHGVIGNV